MPQFPDETELGGVNRAFMTTDWRDILAARDPSDPKARQHLDKLFRIYWKPVYGYIRAVWRSGSEDAKDLTQAFFMRLFEKEPWARLQEEKGSFRTYLRRALQNFLINAKAARKPASEMVDPDAHVAPAESPDRNFDRDWFKCLMDTSIETLKTQLEGEGKPGYYEVFHQYCLSQESGGSVTYAELARQTGKSESDVRNYLSYCRTALRGILRLHISEYATDKDEVERELRDAAGP